MNQTERECIILNSAWAMVDGMVNWTMFSDQDLLGSTMLRFESREHAELFIIRLTDFLSPVQSSAREATSHGLQRVPPGGFGADQTFIFHLRQVCRDPQLGDETTNLSNKVEDFAFWLEGRITSREVNLSLIDIVADLEIERYRYIKMCGNIAKHSLARLSRVIDDLRKLLKAAGYDVSIQTAHLAIDQFYERFFEDIFIFHSNQIVEFLNDVRWTIFEYLQLEYGRSWHAKGRFYGDYGFHIPEEVSDPFAQAMYWELMNRVRGRPHMQRFVAEEAFKQPHLSESRRDG